jgi:glutamate/aspartate transport system permease protein
MSYNWNWAIFFDLEPGATGTYFAYLLGGLGWTLVIAGLAWMLALLLGFLVGTLRTIGSSVIERCCFAYTELFRNIPLLVQMFLWYFVLPEVVPNSLGTAIKAIPPPWGSAYPAILCLGTFMSVRVAEQVRAGIASLPRGQMAAALAIGLTRRQAYRYIILPLVIRIILPPLSSEFLNTIKNSSLALTIGVMELTARARAMQEFSFQVFEAFAAATIIYLVVNLFVVFCMSHIEQRIQISGVIGGRKSNLLLQH